MVTSPIHSCLALVPVFAVALACDVPGADESALGSMDGPDTAQEPVALADAAAWVAGDVERDPLADHRPQPVVCSPGSWGDEFGALEVSTASCNYVSLEQPLAVALAEGDEVRIDLWWAALLAPEPAQAHLALLIDGALLWETRVEIPAKADARVFTLASPIAAEPGATLTFHLHNHGQNSWTLASVERLGPSEGG